MKDVEKVKVYHVDEYCEGASHFSFSERKEVVLLEDYEKLREENERMKGELKQIEVQDQVVFDGLRKENAKLECLALHAMSEYCFAQGTIIHTKLEFTEQSIEEDRKMIHKVNIRDRWGEYFAEAYRKAKAKMMEGSNA